MDHARPLHAVVDLIDPGCTQLFDTDLAAAAGHVGRGDLLAVRGIAGSFAIVARDGEIVRLARSLNVPLRYFLAKGPGGPILIVANRIDIIRDWLIARGMSEQFHPSYTRMAPAHHVTELRLTGCPDPNPAYRRFLSPARDRWPADVAEIGRRYVQALSDQIVKWLRAIPDREPIGVCFSGGTDSGAVFLVTHAAMRRLELPLTRLKAFTLAVDGHGEDARQAADFLKSVGMELFHERIEFPNDALDLNETIHVLEDYKPLDVQAAGAMLSLVRGIRARYPEWTYLIDGDGGDENLKDYPIEADGELTIRSILNNSMLYQEGWGVDAIKHSLTYSGGLSRGCARGFAPQRTTGFVGFSPFTMPDVVEVAEGIPFIALTDWRPPRLYEMKGEILAAGVEAVTGVRMPVFPKRRFQHGGMSASAFASTFPTDGRSYRRTFQTVCHA